MNNLKESSKLKSLFVRVLRTNSKQFLLVVSDKAYKIKQNNQNCNPLKTKKMWNQFTFIPAKTFYIRINQNLVNVSRSIEQLTGIYKMKTS